MVDGIRGRRPVFVDADTGVDDALALVYLLASPEAELVGVASTGGNVDVDTVCRNNLGLLGLCGAAQVPVSRGASAPLVALMRTAEDTHGPAGLGYARLPQPDRPLTPHDAAEAWVRAARAHPGELIGLAIGPLTNLALALRAEPRLPGMLKRLVIMGGSFDYRGNTTPVAEWNTSVDPEAAAEVYRGWETGRPPIVCGLNVTENAVMTPQLLDRLAGVAGGPENPLIRVLSGALRFYFEFHRDQGEGYLAHVHDPLAAAVALDPGLLVTREATVDVELTGTLTRAMTIADWDRRWGRPPNALVGTDVDAAGFFERFVDRVGALARRLAHS